MKRFLTAMLIVLSVLMSMCMASYATEADKPLGSSAYYVPVDSSEFELYVNQSGSLVVAGMDLTDNTADVTMYATVSYKMPDGEMVVQDIRKMNAYKNNPMPCVVFEIDEYYASFCDLFITFIDSDNLKPYVEPINVNEFFDIGFSSNKAEGMIDCINYSENIIEFYPASNVVDANGVDIMKAGMCYTLKCENATDYEYYLKQIVSISFTCDAGYELVSVNPGSYGNVLEITPDMLGANCEIGDSMTPVEYYESSEASKATRIYTSDDAQMYLNGSPVAYKDLTVFWYEDAIIRFVENTDDKYYDVVFVTVYEHGIVDSVDASDPSLSRIILTNGAKIYFDFEDVNIITDIEDINGNPIELSDIEPGDVVAMVVGDDIRVSDYRPVAAKNYDEKIKVVNLGQNYVDGIIVEASDEHIYIDGVEYGVSSFVDGNGSEVFEDEDYIGSARLGTEGRFYVSITGKIIGFDGSVGNDINYGYILQTNYDETGFNAGWVVKMLTAEGIATYDLYITVNVDGESVKSESLEEDYEKFVDLTEKNEHKENVAKRIVEYKLTADGKIKNIAFIGATEVAKDEFRESVGKIDSKVLSDTVVVFDISAPDADDAVASDMDCLINENEYAGYVADKTYEWNLFVITEGVIKDISSDDDVAVVAESGDGYILQTNYDETGFNYGWKLKMLTKDGINVYDLYTTVDINGASIKSESLDVDCNYFADFTGKNEHFDNVEKRIVEYGINSDGKIVTLQFIGDDSLIVRGEYSKDDGTVNGEYLADNALIFDISAPDDYDAKAANTDNLTDGSLYSGYLFDDYNGWNIFVVLDGKVSVEENGDTVEPEMASGYGYILQTNYDETGFNYGWKLKMLTKDGINVYDLYTTVDINGASIKSESLRSDCSYFVELTEKNEHHNDIGGRIVEFGVACDGRIRRIDYPDVYDVAGSEYKEGSFELNGRIFAQDAVVLDISSVDADDSSSCGFGELIDKNLYGGYALGDNGDGVYNAFVVTDKVNTFNPSGGLMYITSVSTYIYEGDEAIYEGDEAIKVTYYTDASATENTAVFTDAYSTAVYGSVEYYSLTKGSVFTANINDNGLVSEYAVLATMRSGDGLELYGDVLEGLEATNEDVGFAYGYIEDVDRRGNITLCTDYITDSSLNIFSADTANEYTYNVKIKFPNVEVAAWDSNGIDMTDGETCYYMFVKFYNGDAVDIYSIGYPVELYY